MIVASGVSSYANVALVTGGFFDVLGVKPILGRTLTAADDKDGAEHVIVLGNGLWRRSYGASREVLGRRLVLNDQPPFSEMLSRPLARPRFSAFLLSVFGIVALLLSTVGLYAVMGSTTEIGMRAPPARLSRPRGSRLYVHEQVHDCGRPRARLRAARLAS